MPWTPAMQPQERAMNAEARLLFMLCVDVLEARVCS